MKDQFGRDITYLRVSVTELCSLRCVYCMPEAGIVKRPHCEMMTEEETILAIRTAAELGIKKVRITGGEPLEKRNILSICEKTAAIPGIREVCLTTNALRLPKMAADLKKAGVEHINISLDTLDPDKYHRITRIGRLDAALAGLHAALDTGFSTIKINAVLIGGFNDDEIRPLAELTLKYPIDVRFIELMPMVDSHTFSPEAFIPVTTVLDVLPEAVPLEPDGGVAKLYRLPGTLGKVGLISPVSAQAQTLPAFLGGILHQGADRGRHEEAVHHRDLRKARHASAAFRHGIHPVGTRDVPDRRLNHAELQ